MRKTVLWLQLQLLALTIVVSLTSKAQTSQPQDTLEIVNWNLEFFGDTPSDLPEEMIKTKTIMDSLDADIYALVEIVNTDSLNRLVQSLQGNYNYLVSPYGSFAASPSSINYAEAQKLVFVYRTSVVKNVTGRALLKNSPLAYNYWSSGRYPYLITADVLGKDNQWRLFRFIIIHAKAYSDFSSCSRRYEGALELKDTLDAFYPTDRLIILGDYNDDLDISICPGFSESNYSNFVKDSSDANSYKALTLPLSLSGVASIAGYPSFLDHVIVSNEVVPYYVHGSAEMLKNKVSTWASSYTSDVSDHYPVLTKYVMDQATGIKDANNSVSRLFYPVPASNELNIANNDGEYETYTIFNVDGKQLLHGKLQKNLTNISLEKISPGSYFIRLISRHAIRTGSLVIIK